MGVGGSATYLGLELPEEDVVARDGGRVDVARVLGEDAAEGVEEELGFRYGIEEVLLVGLVGVDAEDHVAAVDETELWGGVSESSDLQDVADSVSVES